MAPKLSEGALLTICEGGNVQQPVLQVLGYKKIAGASVDRYRVFVSDGVYSNSFAMLATQMNEKIASGQMETFAVIKVKNHVCNNLQGKKVIILLDIEILEGADSVGKKLGEPVNLNADGTVSASAKPQQQQAAKRPAEQELKQQPEAKRSPLAAKDNKPRSSILDPRPVSSSGGTAFDPNNAAIFPIASLTPYQNKWTIKARVTHKSDIRRWSNSRGEGHLFSMDLLDESGEIRATAFKEQCDKYYNMIEVGKLYYITSCSLKAANKQFSNLNNEYEMTFRDSTEVIPSNEDSSNIPTLSFNFVKIADLANVEKDSTVDIIAICKSAGDATTFTSQRTQKELTKRDLTLVDQSLTEVNITLWGTTAETFDASNNPVVAVKNCKVSDFNGVSLSALSSSVIQINPDLKQSHTLKGWYDNEGSSKETTSLTQAGQRNEGNDSGMGANSKTLGEVKLERLGYDTVGGKSEFYSTSAYVTMIMKDKALYQSCSQRPDGKPCQKKVLDLQNGSYRCEKCQVEMNEFNWRLLLSLSIADMTDNQWVTCFQDQAEQILDMKAEDLGNLFQNDQDQYNKVFANASFKHYNFRLSCKADNYNDETRVRHVVRAITPISNWEERNKKMIQEIKENGESPLPHFDWSKYQ